MAKGNKLNPAVADKGRELVGEFFKNRREELGLTQGELAEMAGVNRQALISDFEKGKANITINTLFALCGCLRVKPYFETADPENDVPGFGKVDLN